MGTVGHVDWVVRLQRPSGELCLCSSRTTAEPLGGMRVIGGACLIDIPLVFPSQLCSFLTGLPGHALKLRALVCLPGPGIVLLVLLDGLLRCWQRWA